MIIIGLSDIHGVTEAIRRLLPILPEADVVVLAGDITHFGREDQAREVLEPLMAHGKKVLGVSGNCDYREVDACLESLGIQLHARRVVCGDIGFIGLGGSLITPFHTPNEYTENEIRRFLCQAHAPLPFDAPLVLVSHQPPVATSCDCIAGGKHVGSLAVREFIEIHQPRICICGHIHESMAVDRIAETWIINPGSLGKGQYAWICLGNDGDRVEIRKIPS